MPDLNHYFVRTPGSNPEILIRTRTKEASTRPLFSAITLPDLAVATLTPDEARALSERGAEVIPSRRYEPVSRISSVYRPLVSHPKNLTDVLDHINAPKAWERSRGAGIHIAIIDTGICGTMLEFPAAKQSNDSWKANGDPWSDSEGHGSMTGCVAAGTKADGGRYDGVAPDATIISCRTSFDETDLFLIYEHLIGLVRAGSVTRIVTNNSYGSYTCEPLGYDDTHPMVQVIREAVNAGIVPVFAAGNNHVAVCSNDREACSPNTIWGINSLDEVVTVGTVNERERMDEAPASGSGFSHSDSSRGPGEMAKTSTKPDCVAPTYGEVVWGCGYQAMEWWGTSGAAPQVAGLAALILAREPKLTVAEVAAKITGSCRDIGLGSDCAGSGIIDCEIAVP